MCLSTKNERKPKTVWNWDTIEYNVLWSTRVSSTNRVNGSTIPVLYNGQKFTHYLYASALATKESRSPPNTMFLGPPRNFTASRTSIR